ncbi:MAG: HesA/MoeB/ThiF family protein [Clostridiales bacterium 38_11]|nr:MAG: HesA/MoeB/ThiF family protein [Clostridiales bacterium 38_11]HBH12668.1 tRNA cyclic N6-threonylcarbamoyladenosine(37) synthase TcdA [Clostridiales bacterium]
MKPWDRLQLVYGEASIEKLINSRVMIVGVGGVGSYSAEAIARCFIGGMTLVDFDTYELTNLNRQLHSNQEVLGKHKVDVIAKELKKINPNLVVNKQDMRINEINILELFNGEKYDYVIDAIDDINAKLLLVDYCKKNDIPIISCMGTGNRRNPQSFAITDISETFNCPMAKKMRRELKRIGIEKHQVVFSRELPLRSENQTIIGSNSFVPASAGLLLASHVINCIVER